MGISPGIGLAAAFVAGVVSFASPCVLPLVPAYLSVITGLSPSQVRNEGRLGKVVVTAGGFIAGFTAVFVSLGLAATGIGHLLLSNRLLLERIAGLVVLAMALFLGGSLVVSSPWMYQEKRWHPHLDRFGRLAAPVAGVAFGLGWTPCIGPLLASVLMFAAASGHELRGAELLAAYSAGLAVPFMALAVAFDRLAGGVEFMKRHFVPITALSAVILGLFGTLLALGQLQVVTTAARSLAAITVG